MRIVADACYAGAWLLPDESSRGAERRLREILKGDCELCVPHLWGYELTNLLLVAERRKRLSFAQVSDAHELIETLPKRVFDHESALARERTTLLARRFALSAYDASYLELADRLQCRLETLDARLKKAAKGLAR